MMSYKPGDLLLLHYPFTSGGQSKPRPALVIRDSGDADVLVARVTTQGSRSQADVPLDDWQQSGLLAHLDKLATLEKSLVKRVLGNLTAVDRAAVRNMLNALFANW